MAIEDIQCARQFLVSVISHTVVGSVEKNFQNKDSRWLEDAIFILVFANTVLHKIAIFKMLCKHNLLNE